MRGLKGLKKSLLIALCVILMVPVADLTGGCLVAEASSVGGEGASLPQGDVKASEDYKKDAKQAVIDHYRLYEAKIKEAGNEKEALAYLESMIGKLDKAEAENVIASQNFESGVDNLKSMTMKDIEAYAVKAEAPEAPETEEEPEPESSNSNIMVGGNWVTPVAKAGQYVNVVLPVVNMGEDMVRDAVVTPAISGNAAEWPFEIEKSSYTQTIADLPGTHDGGTDMERRRELTWSLKTRKDAPSGYVKISFDVTYQNSDDTVDTATLVTYVKVVGTTGTSADGTTSTPRVIVTGFSTTPEVVHAGETFTLTLHMQNTSKATAVKNMLFDLQAASESTDSTYVAAAFLPTSGSSTIYVDSIPAGGSKDISMEMEARADLAQKPYVVTVTMDYEDENVNAYKNTANVSIPIRQEARVDLSSVEVMPSSIEVGGEANIMFSIYNIGKTTLYNTKIQLQADSISGGETYLGNVAPGATGNVDLYVTGQAETMDDGSVKILITFEDEAGEVTTVEESMELYVTPVFYEEDIMFDDMVMMEEPKAGLPWWGIVLIAVGALGAAAVLIVVLKKGKKKKAAKAEAALLEEDLLNEDDSFAE